MTEIGTSGHIAVHVIEDDHGEPYIRIEQVELGEIVDLPDLPTAREVWYLLSEAIARMRNGQPSESYWIDTGSGPGAVAPLRPERG